MERRAAESGWPVASHSRFELAPPRHFLLPALLLLLAEEPGHGYSLTKGLEELGYGRADRPSVYRALAQLERDGLVETWPGTPKAGQARRVYGLTDEGERALRAWMGIIKQERDCLDQVLRRYVATGTIDAVLAEAVGSWAAVTGHPWSPVSSTSRIQRRHARLRTAVRPGREGERRSNIPLDRGSPAPATAAASTFRLLPERSVVLIEARSTVGPITFGAAGLTGHVEAVIHEGGVRPGTAPTAHLQIDVTNLRSGNRLYDAELLRRIDARRHPVVSLDLRTCAEAGTPDRYLVEGDVTFHGSTRSIAGTVDVVLGTDGRLVVRGEQVFDIRDFDIASPTVLMLRIYPDVVVQLQLEAEWVTGEEAG
jgi:PadR family transcriptional regulator, regulatory protein PadR